MSSKRTLAHNDQKLSSAISWVATLAYLLLTLIFALLTIFHSLNYSGNISNPVPITTPVSNSMPIPTDRVALAPKTTSTPIVTQVVAATVTVTSTFSSDTGEIEEPLVDDDPSIGPAEAKVTIIEFSDYQCTYCQAWHQQVFEKLMDNYAGSIRFVYRDFPLSFHPEAVLAAEAANCAGDQGAYWKYHDALFSGQYSLGRDSFERYAADLGLDIDSFTTCLDDHRYKTEVDDDINDGLQLGVDATPTFYINGQMFEGALSYEDFINILEQELAK